MDPTVRVLLFETMDPRASFYKWAHRHLKISAFRGQKAGKPEGCSCGAFAYDDRILTCGCWLAAWIRPPLARPRCNSGIVVDLAKHPLVRTFLLELLKLGGNFAEDVVDFIITNLGLPVVIIMASALFRVMKVHRRNASNP